MVKAIIDISGDANRTLNLIKAKYSLKDKSAAINRMAEEYEREILEPALRRKTRGRVPVVVQDSENYFG
ncbi:DUF2683 family protein [Candidatus Micrarchaeota archaeon]|nr:DUF2683 family protein [Candidatus Micrarchaeota archaeon]